MYKVGDRMTILYSPSNDPIINKIESTRLMDGEICILTNNEKYTISKTDEQWKEHYNAIVKAQADNHLKDIKNLNWLMHGMMIFIGMAFFAIGFIVGKLFL